MLLNATDITGGDSCEQNNILLVYVTHFCLKWVVKINSVGIPKT
jgi:hypothetical protein